MVIYEVMLELQSEIKGEFLLWLHEHIAEILRLPGFTGAQLFSLGPPDSDLAYLVQYALKSPEDLDQYLKHHAPRFRAEGERRFGGQFLATRRVLRLIKTFEAK